MSLWGSQHWVCSVSEHHAEVNFGGVSMLYLGLLPWNGLGDVVTAIPDHSAPAPLDGLGKQILTFLCWEKGLYGAVSPRVLFQTAALLGY